MATPLGRPFFAVRLRRLGLAAAAILAAGSVAIGVAPAPALAASRLVVVPVSVGGGQDPDPALMAALAEGLRQNPQWSVEQGDSIPSLARYQASAFSEAELTRQSGELEAVARKTGSEAVETFTRLRDELRAGAKRGPRGPAGDELLWRSSLLLASALVTRDPAQARKVAQETLLIFPGRTPGAGDKLSPAAAKLFEPLPPDMGARLKLLSRPAGCHVFIGETDLGPAPVEVAVLQEEAYWAQVRCTGSAPAAAGPAGAAPAGAVALASRPKRIVVPPNENARQELLDAEFERSFSAEGLRRLRFGSANERRELEESYARRLSERFDADAVVLASVGELSGADWLNARLYLRSGYLNRQGLVRLEAQRSNALGRYLATGKDVPGVLKPEEAGELVAAARLGPPQPKVIAPWYSDIAGWSFLGAGLVTVGLGRYITSGADDKQRTAEAIRNDSERQGALLREAQSQRFWGGVATVGGLLLTSTGIVLLLVPEYSSPEDEMFAMPSVVPGGGGLVLGGRF